MRRRPRHGVHRVSGPSGQLLRLSVAVAVAVGGLAAAAPTTVNAAGSAPSLSLTRWAGVDRYATAAAIAAGAYPGGAASVVVASGGSFPDALAASYLAGIVAGPILLSAPTSLPTATSAEIVALGVTHVYVVGGLSAISTTVQSALSALSSGGGHPVVTRLAGTTRYDTDAAVAQFPASAPLGTITGATTAFVVSGSAFPDALAVSPIADALHIPILLTDPAVLSPQVTATIEADHITHIVIAGGAGAVSAGVEAALTAGGVSVERVAGADRTATAAALASWAVANAGFTTARIALARGDQAGGGVDALALAALAGARKEPLLLAASPADLGAGATSWLATNGSTLTGGDAAGGPTALSDTLLTQLVTTAGGAHAAGGGGGGGGGNSAAVTSTGGVTTVSVSGVTLSAAAGAIAAGQTLTITDAAGSAVTAVDPSQLLAGPFTFSTSQGQPAGPVTITYPYHPAALALGSAPLVLHQDDVTGIWGPEATTVDVVAGTASATFQQFSGSALADQVNWAVGIVDGSRATDTPQCVNPPTWIDGPPPFTLNDALLACTASFSDTRYYLNVVNNRSYPETLTITGAPVDVAQSIWTDSVEGIVAASIARVANSADPSEFILMPGSSAKLAFDKPANLIGVQTVTIHAAASDKGILGSQLLSLFEKIPAIGDTLSLADCVTAALYNLTSADASHAGTATIVDACFQAAVSAHLVSAFTEKVAKAVELAIFYAGAVQAITDKLAGDVFPPTTSFDIKGVAVVNPAIHLVNGALGSIPSVLATSVQLRGAGGTAPYTFALFNTAPSQVPAWAILATDGTLKLTPPTGSGGTYAFPVVIHDSVGQRSPDQTEIVSFTVTGTAGIVAIAHGGSDTSCAVLGTGGVDCWGNNYAGDLGAGLDPGTTASSNVPVPVTGIGTAIAVAVDGAPTFCALLSTGGIDCWGNNEAGNLGAGSAISPTSFSAVPVPVSGISDAIAITGSAVSGPGTFCAVLSGGGVDCWGFNGNGDLGAGINPNDAYFSDVPVPVSGLTDAVSVTSVGVGSAGAFCAVRASGGISCWGANNAGVLGAGLNPTSTTYTDAPVSVTGLSHAISVTSSAVSFCALLLGGTVDCWGDNGDGELGAGLGPASVAASDVPVAVVGVANARSVAGNDTFGAGGYCAALISGGVECWGDNAYGELGAGLDPTTTPLSASSVAVTGIADASAIIAGGAGTYCAVLTSGSLTCWGNNDAGELGAGLDPTVPANSNSDVPVAVIGISDSTAILVGGDGTVCAIKAAGGADCWGNNDWGQMGAGLPGGNGAISTLPMPVLIPGS
jgi:putative cell wall-binding protein/alpha-tubulin suppressor-like RCC1 family protein